MENRSWYFYAQQALTFLMLYCLVSLSGGVLSGYWLYIVLGLPVVFYISWAGRDGAQRYLKNISIFGALGSFIMVIYAVLNSSFFYKETLAIWVRGIFLLEVILALNAFSPAFLSYIQVLSIPLFMSWPVFVTASHQPSIIPVVIYLICWFALLKIKFYEFSVAAEKKNFRFRRALIVPAVTLFGGIFVSYLVFQAVAPNQIKKGGVFPHTQSVENPEFDMAEAEFYELQGKMQDRITRSTENFSYNKDKYKANAWLSVLVKNSPEVLEVKKAEEGLVSLLEKPGLGLEDSQDQGEATKLLNNYVDHKVGMQLKSSRNNVVDNLRKNISGLWNRFLILVKLNGMRSAQSYSAVRSNEKGAQETVNASRVAPDAKVEIKDWLRKFREWKELELYRKRKNLLEKEIAALDAVEKKEFSALLEEVNNIENASQFQDVSAKIEELGKKEGGRYAGLAAGLKEFMDLSLEFSVEEKIRKIEPQELSQLGAAVTKAESIAEANDIQEKIETIKEALPPGNETPSPEKEVPLPGEEIPSPGKEAPSPGGKKAAEKLEEILDLKTEMLLAEKKEEDARELAKIKSAEDAARPQKGGAGPALGWIILSAVIALGSVVFIVSYVLTEQERSRLERSFSRDPRKFIVELGENARAVLSVFGLKCAGHVPPLDYGRIVQKSYAFNDDCFLDFIARFEEAKYSVHFLSREDAAAALRLYNESLRTVSSRQRKLSLFFLRYPLAVLKQKPIFIAIPKNLANPAGL